MTVTLFFVGVFRVLDAAKQHAEKKQTHSARETRTRDARGRCTNDHESSTTRTAAGGNAETQRGRRRIPGGRSRQCYHRRGTVTCGERSVLFTRSRRPCAGGRVLLLL